MGNQDHGHHLHRGDHQGEAAYHCAADVSKLTQKAAALSQNSAALKDTRAKVKSLTGSRRNRAIRATATTCTEVISKVKQLITVVSQSPSSTMVYTLSVEISQSTVTCTTEEKASLAAQEDSLSEAADSVDEALESAQADLEAATGTTASTASLSEAAASSSSTASSRLRLRLRNFNLA